MQSLEATETNGDVELLQGGLWQTVAMAIGFAISIPLYLGIEHRVRGLGGGSDPVQSHPAPTTTPPPRESDLDH
jgi:hypothetical protein